MSDLFISAGFPCDADAIAKRLSWTPYTKTWSGSTPELTWIVTRVDDPSLWSPAYDPQSGVRALLGGRIAPEEAEWAAAERLPYDGGLACRLIIDRWLNGGAKAVEALNGGAQIIIIDERKRQLHTWTDRMGFYPAFAWTDGGFLLCSHPDVAASALEAAGRPCDFDPVTMAEFLRTGTATHPHTYWRGIRHMDAATHFELEFGGAPRVKSSTVYWKPAYLRGETYLTDRREIVDRLATALSSAVRRRTLPRLGKVGVLLSAGADSRTALFGACDPAAVKCFTFCDEPNAEILNAQALAEVAGASHTIFRRDRDYYFEHAPDAVRTTGGMWSIDSAHYGGLLPQLSGNEAGVVITGCYTDYLLKGLAYNRRHRELAGRSLPIYALEGYRHDFYQPFAQMSQAAVTGVDGRLEQRFSGIGGPAPTSASKAEYLRLSPIVREADAAGRLLLRHTTPFDLFTADNDVVELAGSIHPNQKVSGIPFGMAVEKITGDRARHIRNNNYNARVGASEWERVASFVLASIKRKVTGQGGGQPYEKDPTSVATVGSWPYFPRVIKMSERARGWRASLAKEQEDFLFDMLGTERRSWTIDDWADREPSLFLRLYTASLWLSQQPQALGRMKVEAGHV